VLKIEENNAIKAYETNSAIDDSLFKPLVVVGPSGVGKGTLIKFITT
jgi:putative ribosome biogenesis GTPase RsgA